jgi:hypothetical protein
MYGVLTHQHVTMLFTEHHERNIFLKIISWKSNYFEDKHILTGAAVWKISTNTQRRILRSSNLNTLCSLSRLRMRESIVTGSGLLEPAADCYKFSRILRPGC